MTTRQQNNDGLTLMFYKTQSANSEKSTPPTSQSSLAWSYRYGYAKRMEMYVIWYGMKYATIHVSPNCKFTSQKNHKSENFQVRKITSQKIHKSENSQVRKVYIQENLQVRKVYNQKTFKCRRVNYRKN